MKYHGGSIASWEDQGSADTSGRADSAKDICRASSLILGGRGTRPPFCPAPGSLCFLPDPGLVLPPDFYGRSNREPAPDFRHLGWEFFLNTGPASGSWA